MDRNAIFSLVFIGVYSIGAVNCVGTCDPEFTLGIVGYLYCYRVSDVRMTWSDANKECKKYDAFLLQVFEPSTWQDVQQITNTSTTTRWWTGLNDQGPVGDWVFDTGPYKVQPDMTQVSWLTEPDDISHNANCGALNYQGSVSDERCGDLHRYICEYAVPSGQSCLAGWSNFTTGCYLMPFGLEDPFSLLTWPAAQQKCQTVLNGTAGPGVKAHLLYIETQDELNFIRNTLPLTTLTSDIWWIGMTDTNQPVGHFIWSDGSPVNNQLVVWAQEPNNLGGQERCAYINRAGKYGDLNCAYTESYICQKETADTGIFPRLGCPGSWTRAGHSCYLLEYANKKSWQDAMYACQQAGASLLSVDDPDEKSWLEDQNFMFRNGFMFWTGLTKGGDSWTWADGTAANMDLIKWNTEPNNYNGSQDCAVINRKGFLNDINCLLPRGFICETNSEDSPCPIGWVSNYVGDQTNCYYISNTSRASFDEAHAQCNQLAFPLSAFLVAFNSHAELLFLQSQLASKTGPFEWYTGLTDRGHEGFWAYDTSFNPAPDQTLLPWGHWPMFQDGDENCVSIILGAQYVNMKCQRKLPYICEKLAAGISSKASRGVHAKFSASSVFVLILYFLVYGICLHYILHLTYVLSPGYAWDTSV